MKREKDIFRKLDNVINILKSQYGQLNISRVLLDVVTGRRIKNEKLRRTCDSLFETIDLEELRKEIVKNALEVADSSLDLSNRNYCDEFVAEVKSKKVPYNKLMEYVEEDEETLCKLTVAFANQRYKDLYRKPKDDTVKDSEIRKYVYYLEPTNRTDRKTPNYIVGKVSNLLFNKSKLDVLLDSQVKHESRSYKVGNSLYAHTNIGKVQEKQEDGVLLLEHPKNKKFKLLAVADGDSSKVYGEKASNYVLTSILHWFENLDESYYEKPEALKELINNKLRQINVELLEDRGNKSSSFTCAIVGKNKTLISSIGDTRAYTYSYDEGTITRVTHDDSYIQVLCDLGYVDEKYARFHKASKIVNKQLGICEYGGKLDIETKCIPNDYAKLIIVSDGVTKCIDEKEIVFFSKYLKDEDLATLLVNASMRTESKMDKLLYGYNEKIPKGAENSTAAVYVKR